MRFFLPMFLVALSGFALTEVRSFSFNFSSFQDQDAAELSLTNTSRIFLNAIQVTPDVQGASIANMSGRSLFGRQFRLWSGGKGFKLASFNTSFVLNIQNRTSPGGEGLAFVLTADSALPANSYGQWLGLVNVQSNGSRQARIVAVEFDTMKSFPEDLNDNHVGLDVNSVYSIQQFNLSSKAVYLSSGNDTKVLVQYDSKNLTVFVGEDMENPVISEAIDLSAYLSEKVYIGFSGSTSSYTELNCVKSWEFTGSDIGDDADMLWVWITVPAGLILMIAAALFLYWKKKSESKEVDDAFPSIEEAIKGSSTAPRKFHFKELSKATGKFNPKNKLGKGGFGTVYKGVLGNREVAVKRVSKKSTQGKQEFIAEVTIIGNLHHRNLVKLIGWCYEKREFLLVYEYMPNGSLDKFIFFDDKSGTQDSTMLMRWETRLSVITGAAQALDYLHNGCEKRVLHRDIKASNIMLDFEFNARLGDFGLARTIDLSDQTHHSTKELAGTPGYIAPESVFSGRATVETDVYAFGVMLLEVACGRKPGGQNEQNDYNSNIVNWVWQLYAKGEILDAADPRLKGVFEEEDMACVLILGLACCHPNPNKRPSMKAVLQVLTGEAPPPEVPTERPAFMWPPLPPSFKDLYCSIKGSELNPFTEITGR